MSRSAYYKWLNRKPTNSEKRIQTLIHYIQYVYKQYKGIYGYRRITIYLNQFLNARVNHKCVYRLMNLLGLKAVIRRKRYRYKHHIPKHTADNILNREFQRTHGSMEVLLTDVTEFKYGNHSKAYLSAVLDLGTQQILAYKLSKKNDNDLVSDTFQQLEERFIPHKTLIHSDRGYQYTSRMFRAFIRKYKLTHSMSRVGKCIDNGPMENIWGIIKEEMYRLKTYQTFDDLKHDIENYVQFFNTERITLKMGLRIPT